jgi:4'-phosphopantetheinyl transferase EntD
VTGLFDDPRVRVLTSPISDACIALLSETEAGAVAGVVEKRRREFGTARVLARTGLERFFGVRGFDLLNAPDRAPIWPDGITGSIAHSHTRAWVALVDSAFGTVGIDGEDRDELGRNLWHLTLRDEEVACLETLDCSTPGRRALAIFSAKEALYKAQYPRSRSFMDYKALRVEFGEAGLLRGTFQQTVGPFPKGFVVHGRWLDGDSLVTAIWIPRAAGSEDR